MDKNWCVDPTANTCPYTKFRQPWDKPFYILLNLAVGGGFFNPATYGTFDPVNDPKTWSRPSFEIDYVRVYQPN